MGAYNQVAASYIFTNFSLSHTHLPVTEADEFVHWVEYAAKHTTNISPSPLCNWWMANLNFQVEHHLFPAMPQFQHSTSRRACGRSSRPTAWCTTCGPTSRACGRRSRTCTPSATPRRTTDAAVPSSRLSSQPGA